MLHLVPPPPPANVTYSDVRETRVLVDWEPPELDRMFSIKRYYITYLKQGEKEWFNNTINADQETNFQVDDLESDTFYTLKVIAENDYGLGKESSKMRIKTMKVKGTFSKNEFSFSAYQIDKGFTIVTIFSHIVSHTSAYFTCPYQYILRDFNCDLESFFPK